jgi:Flp pilus assembly protein TadG
MRWLISRLIRSDRERGASVVLVAILTTAVLFAMGAVAVDLGAYYTARGETQNGADAAAVAVARTCAKGSCDTSAGDQYGGLNSGNLDTSGEVSHGSSPPLPCGNGPGLTACDPSIENGTICPIKPGSLNYVDVQVRTEKNGGVPAFFSAAFGNGRKKIGACAQAAWGPRSGGTGFALTMSLCAWQAATANGTMYATPAPPYRANPWPPAYPNPKVDGKNPVVANPGGENVVEEHGSADNCKSSVSGQNVPGGFGWLSDQANGQTPANCQVTTQAGGFVYSSSGGIGGQNGICGTRLQSVYDASTGNQVIPNSANPIYLPVFDAACNSTGNLEAVTPTTSCTSVYPGMPNSSYHIAGYAEFILTGADYNPFHDVSLINGASPCNGGSFSCLYGMFTKNLITDSGDICTSNCGTDYGAPIVVKLYG